MDKIKTVKIKNEDGSISEESYTISVDARNVDMDNGKDLQDTIGTINIDTDGDIASQLKKIKNYDNDIENINNDISDLQDVDDELNNRIFNLEIDDIALNNDIKKKAYFFDTVADMKNANLKAGDYVCTLGYYSVNDGGAAEYQIINKTNSDIIDEMFILQLSNSNLIAKILINNIYKPEQCGAKNDGSQDCALVFQTIFNKMVNNSQLILSGTYLINQPLYLPNTNNITINGGTFKAGNSFEGYILNSNLTKRMGYSGWNYATENLILQNVFIDGSYKASGLYLNSYLRVKIISCTFHNFKEYGIYLNNGHEATIISTNLIGRTNGDTEIANIGIYIGCHDNIVDSCIIAYCQWAMYITESANQICNSHFYCNRLNGGNIKTRTSQLLFDNNYFDGSGIYLINPWETVFSNNTFNLTSNTHHIIKLDTDLLPAQVNIKGVYITNTIVRDNRNSSISLDLIECTFNPTQVENCYIDKINNPTYVNINNPYNIFSFKNNNNPIIVSEGIFRATNINHNIGEHSTLDNFYEYSYNANFIKTNYIGSTSVYPWLFFKIYVPEKMRIVRNMSTLSSVDFFNEDETYIGNDKVTLEKGYYWVGVYRTVDLYLSTD